MKNYRKQNLRVSEKISTPKSGGNLKFKGLKLTLNVSGASTFEKLRCGHKGISCLEQFCLRIPRKLEVVL